MPTVNRYRRSSGGSSDTANARIDVCLTFLEQPRVAVCTHCRYTIKPGSGIEDHFRKTY
ncbi:hypothetical protein LX36DRAFT_291092 [Colletotrichum falcatum]|nr:hypothetical protein LX36DRAFT_291092 [Colletotrichum falcatum]